MVGVVGHMANPTSGDVVSLARSAEVGGATWAGFADAFWWRDVWIQLLAVAEATSSIEVGPAMTNAYLRHPFHTVAALATLQEHASGRTFLGVSAGGSTVAGVSKSGSGTEVLLWTSDGGMRSLNDVLPNDLTWEAAWWSGP